MSVTQFRWWTLTIGGITAATLLAVALVERQRRAGGLVVYCAHDRQYAEPILREFERRSGIPLIIRYDTEATKSLGLTQLILSEADRPQCDVFWNNQALGTIALREAGVLEPYRGEAYRRIPDPYRDPEGYWLGFGGRLRVVIFNTRNGGVDEQLARQVFPPGDLSRAAIAKPLYGTTLTHYTALWHQLGGGELKRRHRDAVQRGLKIVPGNATVKDLVARGACDWGWTDTDDAFAAIDAGYPVDMLPVRLPDGRTLCIPNTVAIIRGTRKRRAAEALVDYLGSAEVELRLARSPARQIPLGPVDPTRLPEDVRGLARWAADAADLVSLAASREPCLRWLTEQFGLATARPRHVAAPRRSIRTAHGR